MKIIYNTLINRCLILFMAIVGIGIISCDDNPSKEVMIPAGGGIPEVNIFSPLKGGFETEISFYGSNLPTDLSKIRVTINNKEAEVTSSNGRIVTAIIQKDTGSGAVKIYVDNDNETKEFTFPHEFEYGFQTLVSTYLGDGTKEDVDGPRETARLKGPYRVNWDNAGGLFILEEGGSPSTPTNYSAVRRLVNDELETLFTGLGSTEAEKMRTIVFSNDYNTLYVTNDKDANGTMGLGMLSIMDNFSSMTALIDNASETTLTAAVHPVTGDIFIGRYNSAAIMKYENGSLDLKMDILSANGTLTDMIFSKDGEKLYISIAWRGHSILVADYDKDSDTFSNLRTLAGPAVTVPGNAVNQTGYVDAKGDQARFNNPQQIDIDDEDNIYVADADNHCIRKVTPDGTVTTYAGTGKSAGFVNGEASIAKFNKPFGCKFGPDGALYIADNNNHRIRRIAVQ